MKTMSFMLLTFALVAATGAPAAQTQKTGPWKSLFDGKSLDAWRIYKSDKAPKMCGAGETTTDGASTTAAARCGPRALAAGTRSWWAGSSCAPSFFTAFLHGLRTLDSKYLDIEKLFSKIHYEDA